MVTLQEARKIIDAAEKRAAEIGQPMNIAVVDEGGNLVSHVRMDGAWIGSIDIAINKAFTSRAFDDLNQGPGAPFAIGRPILWNSRFQSRPRHGLRWRHPAETRWEDCRRNRSQRRLRRAGSRCG